MSTSWDFDLQWLILRQPLLTCSLIKWHLVSMCLLWPWDAGYLARSIADLLSTSNFIFCNNSTFNPFIYESRQAAWQATSQAEMYSTSNKDRATTCSLVELYDIWDFSRKKIYLVVLFLSHFSSQQSTFEYALTSKPFLVSSFETRMSNICVPIVKTGNPARPGLTHHGLMIT